MPEGMISRLFIERGFGFIRSSGEEYFFHHTGIAGKLQITTLQIGQKVSFELAPSKLRPGEFQAVKVKPINTTPTSAPAADPVPHGGRKGNTVVASPSAPTTGRFPPYRFSAVDIELAIKGTPVWHYDEGSEEELLSGEIHCELIAQTPLIPGNYRYKAADAKPEHKTWTDITKSDETLNLEDNKQIAEPLRLEDGSVVIAGSALKGMIRHSLSALLCAPMERVAERRYTYRPNFGHAAINNQKLVVRPAVVSREENGTWFVKVMCGARDAQFRGTPMPGDIVCTYKGGIDGKGKLAESFNANNKVYSKAYISQQLVDKASELAIPREVYESYLRSQQILQEDHLANHPQKKNFDSSAVAKAIEQSTKLDVGQLIYVEVELNSQDKTKIEKILSMGHHYQYRWAYTSSVRQKDGKTRAYLAPLSCEQVPSGSDDKKDVPPQCLTAARLLFGYVKSADTPIGKGVYERLAGRIAINHAVSDGEPEFIDAGNGIPLRTLGQPRPSAVEFYLRQPGGKLFTYGDLPGDSGGELAGRKFYLHQPRPENEKWDNYLARRVKAGTEEEVKSDLATLARYVCRPGTKFKFTLRFSRLRLWELGALLVTLEPRRLSNEANPSHTYAHKLGLGRPLGLGSVQIKIREMKVRKEADTKLSAGESYENEAVKALQGKLPTSQAFEKHKKRWLDLHAFVDRGFLDYPRRNGKIHTWHTQEVRQAYARLRRELTPNYSGLLDKVQQAHKIPT